MAYLRGTVYDPPLGSGFPHIAVLLRPDGEVLVAESVPSLRAGELLLEKISAEFQAKLDADKAKRGE